MSDGKMASHDSDVTEGRGVAREENSRRRVEKRRGRYNIDRISTAADSISTTLPSVDGVAILYATNHNSRL